MLTRCAVSLGIKELGMAPALALMGKYSWCDKAYAILPVACLRCKSQWIPCSFKAQQRRSGGGCRCKGSLQMVRLSDAAAVQSKG